VSTVRRWVRRFKDRELGQADLSDKTRRTDFKKGQRWRKCIKVCGDFVEKCLCSFKNN
jgi:hypothetical protein